MNERTMRMDRRTGGYAGPDSKGALHAERLASALEA
jgi:hypothetical protein